MFRHFQGKLNSDLKGRLNFGSQKRHGLHFWLRSESKPLEKRVILLPEHSKKLIQKGHSVTIEKSDERCVPISQYLDSGCSVAEADSWPSAPSDAVIMGLKELPPDPYQLKHNHVFFGHCFKGQKGGEELLSRFKEGGGKLWDLEFLVDENNRRVAAFGSSAGMVGMALGLYVWGNIKKNKKHQPLKIFEDYKELIEFVKRNLEGIPERPSVLIAGAGGNVGKGSLKLLQNFETNLTTWDKEETQGKSGPFSEILNYDIFVNTINLQPNSPPFTFLTKDLISNRKRKLSVIADISCDQNNKANPLPIFGKTTGFFDVAARLEENPPLDIIAIDHLPSLVPEESSREFGSALLPHLNDFGISSPWKKAEHAFLDIYKKLNLS